MNGVSSRSAAIGTSRPRNRSPRLRSSAPGTSPASARTWNPLQIPSTSPPSSANAATERITGVNRAITPGPQVVAVGEAARQDDRRDAIERRLLVPQRHGLGAGPLQRVERVAVAVAPREDDDADPHAHAGTPVADDAAPIDSIAYASMSGLASSSPASRSTTASAAASSGGVDRQLDASPDADRADALDPEVAEAALDRATLGVEDAGLGRDVDGEPVACSSGDDVLREIAIEAGAGDPLVGGDVALARAVDDLGRERGAGCGLVPRLALEPVAHELLVEAGLWSARLVGRRVPEPRRVRRQDLVDEDQVAGPRRTPNSNFVSAMRMPAPAAMAVA